MLNNLFTQGSKPTYSEETIDILRLIRSENVGSRTFAHLIRLFGSATRALENVADFSVKGGRLRPIKVFPKAAAERELEQLTKDNAYLLTYKDFNYSQLLLQIHDFPPVLSYKGDASLLNSEKAIGIVGARNSSVNCRSFAAKIAADLVKEGYVTVSGLARGIDTAVHSASLGQTIAVIAGGIDHVYPQENKQLFEKIINESLLIAELPIGASPVAKHFPQRN
ncbi:DNA-processing protein DprA, partial [Rickettsiaceae bacterium]|nr:DNA-processing protein DprA [Rickettsiaceae bacterium]